MAERLFRQSGIRVDVIAHRVELVPAVPAGATGERVRDDESNADPEVRGAMTDLDELTTESLPEDAVLLHRRDVAVVEVQVRLADRRRGDLHDRVAVVEDLRIRDVLHLHGFAARPDVRPHQTPAFSSSDSSSGWAGRCLNLRSAC